MHFWKINKIAQWDSQRLIKEGDDFFQNKKRMVILYLKGFFYSYMIYNYFKVGSEMKELHSFLKIMFPIN